MVFRRGDVAARYVGCVGAGAHYVVACRSVVDVTSGVHAFANTGCPIVFGVIGAEARRVLEARARVCPLRRCCRGIQRHPRRQGNPCYEPQPLHVISFSSLWLQCRSPWARLSRPASPLPPLMSAPLFSVLRQPASAVCCPCLSKVISTGSTPSLGQRQPPSPPLSSAVPR